MAHKISDTGFFQRRTEADAPRNGNQENEKTKAEPLKIGNVVQTILADSKNMLNAAGCPSMAADLEQLRQSAGRERFTVAVVGEFSRGKSTFLNRLLGKEVLPEGDLPTTAVMTRIWYHDREALMAFDKNNKKVLERALSQESWEGLVAQNFGGEDFQGTVLAGVKNEWLRDWNVELIDTPGAGDLSETRAKVVGEALLGCDGAVIAVSATAALGLSEKLFIEERLTAQKMPFLMLIITKLALVPKDERAQVVGYIANKLKSWNMEIPIYIPYAVELSEDTYQNITGMDKVMDEIAGWAACVEREKLVETWLLGKTADILKNASSALTEKLLLLEERDEKKRAEQIAAKKQQLAKARLAWGDLHLQMQRRCTNCYQLLLSQIDEYAAKITERLQYELSHAGALQRWWREDFPYRMKMELTNMAVSIDAAASKQIENDVRWYCISIEKTFQSHVLYQKETIVDKHMFEDVEIGGSVEVEDFSKQHTAIKIGSAVLSVSGYALFSAMGFMPIIATMGIGTGTTIFSERFFKRKLEEQRNMLRDEIARCVPILIEQSMEDSEKRLEAVYQNIISEADKTEQAWLDAQQAAIDGINASKSDESMEEEKKYLKSINEQIMHINALLQAT